MKYLAVLAGALGALFVAAAMPASAQTPTVANFGRVAGSPPTICVYDAATTPLCNTFMSVDNTTHVVTLGGSGIVLSAASNVLFFPGATSNVQSTGQAGADFTTAPCWATNTCGLMLYSAPAAVAQNIIAMLRVQRTASYSGGVVTNTAPAIWVLDTTSKYGNNAQWSILGQQHNKTRASVAALNGGQNVAVNGTHFKDIESSTVTITNASPAVVTWTGSNFVANDRIYFKTTGTLPAPLTTGTTFYIIAAGLTADTFQISTTQGGAAINTTTAGSGIHTGLAEHSFGWGGNFVCEDDSGIVNPGIACVGTEIDIFTIAGAGTDTSNARVGLSIFGGPKTTDSAVRIGTGLLVGVIGGATMDSAIRFAQINTTPIYGTLINGGAAVATTGIDISAVTGMTDAIRVPTGDNICLNGSANCLSYDGTAINFASNLVRTDGGSRILAVGVASLPTCNAGLKGTQRMVSDASGPTFGSIIAGGGTILRPVWCDGADWRA